MWENLFDCRHDSLKEDREFLPGGEKKWTPSRYWRKLDALSKVVAAVGEERLPDLVGLCEVENDSVLFDLTRRSSLRALGYRYVATHSPDVRGIDVALLYQPGSFRLLESRGITVPSVDAGFRPAQCLVCKGKSAFRRYAARARMPFAQSSGERPVFTPPSDVGGADIGQPLPTPSVPWWAMPVLWLWVISMPEVKTKCSLKRLFHLSMSQNLPFPGRVR